MTQDRAYPLAEMTDAAFEKYLRKHGLTGMGAFAFAQKRRDQIAKRDALQAVQS